MDINKLILICLTSIILLSVINSEICSKFTCGRLNDSSLCTYRNITDQVPDYILQKCSKDSQQCPFYNYEKFDNLTCEDKKPKSIKLYPGGNCTSAIDCFSNVCLNSTCIGVANGAVCNDHSECIYNYACRKNDTAKDTKYCLPQLKPKDICNEDYDCQNTHGCYNKTCTAYYSLPDGHPVEITPPRALSFCKSGFEYNMACASLSLGVAKDLECSEVKPCNYTNYDKTSVVIPENCLCGYNPFGKKYCKLGSAHDEYKKYVTKIQNLIMDYTLCNTLERGICNHNKRYPSETFTYLKQNYTNALIKGDNYHELIGANECVVNVVYPEFVPEPSPPSPSPPLPDDKGTCAIFTCKSSQTNCAQSHYTANTTRTDVVLSDICKSTETCDVGGIPNVVFYNKTDVTGKCQSKKSSIVGIRYPGEACETDKDCFSPDKIKYQNESLVGTCLYGVCRGYNETQPCSETAWCWTGLYCLSSNTTGTCQKLKKQGSACTKTTECQNNLLCLNGKCENAWYSKPVGTNVSAIGDFAPQHYCTFGKAYNGVCDSLNTTDIVDSTTKLVLCNEGQMCNYTSLQGPSQKRCECGYNPDGMAYCPMGNKQATDKWISFANAKAKKTNNKCHSENRAECYLDDADLLGNVKNYLHQTESAHLFYGAPSCVEKVLNSSFINFSIISFIAFIALILI